MKHGLACAVLAMLFTASLLAQAAGGAQDPVSGNWGMDGLTFLELKYDGKSDVSGTAIWRHGQGDEQRTPIKSGSFDRETGALRLAGEAQNRAGETVQYLIEGKINGNTVSGTYRVGEDKGEFSFVRQ